MATRKITFTNASGPAHSRSIVRVVVHFLEKINECSLFPSFRATCITTLSFQVILTIPLNTAFSENLENTMLSSVPSSLRPCDVNDSAPSERVTINDGGEWDSCVRRPVVPPNCLSCQNPFLLLLLFGSLLNPIGRLLLYPLLAACLFPFSTHPDNFGNPSSGGGVRGTCVDRRGISVPIYLL